MLSDQRESLGTWLYTRTLNTPEGERSWEVHAVQPTVEDVYLVLGSTGVHASTSKQVAMVAETLENDPSKQQHIDAIGAVARRGMVALMEGDVEGVGRAMTENHLLLRQLGVSSPELEALVQAAAPTALGVKLTGAGGGGCMVALTRSRTNRTGDRTCRRAYLRVHARKCRREGRNRLIYRVFCRYDAEIPFIY